MTMEEDENPKVFLLRLDEKRNELALLGKAIDDDDVLTIILGQLHRSMIESSTKPNPKTISILKKL